MTEAEAREIVERYEALLIAVLCSEGFINRETVGHQIGFDGKQMMLRTAWIHPEGDGAYFKIEAHRVAGFSFVA